MALIVLHCNGNGHEASLDTDVSNMGQHYGAITHVSQNDNLAYRHPNPGEKAVHILAHGRTDGVADMKPDTFKNWIVNAFRMLGNLDTHQTFFIYSCDIALGGKNLLSAVAQHVAALKVRNRTFIGTAGENGVTRTGKRGKILVKDPHGGALQDLGMGWKGYRTVADPRNHRHVLAEKLSFTDVNQAVRDAMNW